MKAFSIVVFFFLVTFVSAAPGKAKAPSVKETLRNLSLAIGELDGSSEPIEFVDQIKAWENLVLSCKFLDQSLALRIQGLSAQLEDYEAKIERYPAKRKFYQSLSQRSERQLDQLYGIKEILAVEAKKLKDKVYILRSDPQVAEILELEAKQEELDRQLSLPRDLVPASVNRAIDKATE
jgi:hypothetical protein